MIHANITLITLLEKYYDLSQKEILNHDEKSDLATLQKMFANKNITKTAIEIAKALDKEVIKLQKINNHLASKIKDE